MRPQTVAVTMDALDRNGICAAQTPSGAGNLTIAGALATGGVATMDVARHVAIYSDADESGETFTITGTDRNGAALTETITGPDTTTVAGSRNFLTVTQVATDGAGTGNIEVGTYDSMETKWYQADRYSHKGSYAVGLSSSADLTYTFEYTLDDIQDADFTEYGAVDFEDLGPKTVESSSALDAPIEAYRMSLTNFTSGTATLTFHQLSGV